MERGEDGNGSEWGREREGKGVRRGEAEGVDIAWPEIFWLRLCDTTAAALGPIGS